MPRTPEQKRRHNEAVRRSHQKHKAERNAKKRRTYRQTKHHLAVRDHRRAIQEAEASRRKPKQCEVCGDDKRRIEFDHCHQRGVFRGWLCSGCNCALGQVGDDPNRLRKLIAYLERTKNIVPSQLTLPGI